MGGRCVNTNLADLSLEERAALETDKVRWFITRHWLSKFDRAQIVAALEAIPTDEEREDMRRRLNEMKKKTPPRRPKPTGRRWTR